MPYLSRMLSSLRHFARRCRSTVSRFCQRIPLLSHFLRWRRAHRKTTVALFLLISHLAGALTSVQAIMHTRTSQGTIAWAISLNTFPYVAVPAYWIFGGSKFEAMVADRRSDRAETQQDTTDYATQLQQLNLVADAGSERSRLVERLTGMPVSLGNDAELLIDGEATFRSIFDGLQEAKDYVLVQFYIIRDQGIGQKFKEALIACAKRGVRVHLLYDDMGCSDLPEKYLRELRENGIQLHAFNTLAENLGRSQLNFRNHRKLVIVDGNSAWAGGINVGDEYLGLDPDVGPWRDTFIKLRGPVVQSMQITFAEDWHWASKEILTLNRTPKAVEGGVSRQILSLPSGPADPLETCTLFHLHLINAAQKRLWIASPYFVPDEQFLSALHLAALRGVDVRIIVPEKSDGVLVNLSGWSFVEDLERSGVRFYRHQKGFLHQKVLLVDNETCTIGTANFDNRSFRLNFELTIAVFDPPFCAEVEKMLERDLADSRPVSSQEMKNKGFWWRFAVRAARILSPIQ